MQSKPTLFILPGVFGEDWRLLEFCAAASADFRPVVLHHRDGDGCHGLMEAGRGAAERISNAQRQGRINLLGYSYGGNVAFGAVAVLRGLGRDVSFLCIVDPALPDTEFDPFSDEPARVRDFQIRESRLLLFLLRRRLVWAASRVIPWRRLKRRVRRRMCVASRGWARRRWVPQPVDASGLLVTSSQFHGVTGARLRALCPAMRHIRVESRHADVLAGASGAAIVAAIRKMRSPDAGGTDRD